MKLEQIPSINLRAVAESIQKKMCLYQKPDRNYAFVDMSEAAQAYESDMPMISKQLGQLGAVPRNSRGAELAQALATVSKSSRPKQDIPTLGSAKKPFESRDQENAKDIVVNDLEKRTSSGQKG